MRKIVSMLAACAAAIPAALVGQQAPVGPQVGDMAPDFTLTASTQAGIAAKPVKLSDLKGRTVVIAFFPRQRTGGCTVQMRAYRDKYQEIFGGGKEVSLFAVSTDSAKDQASWAAEEKFPFTFLSDAGGDAGRSYGTLRPGGSAESRVLFVIGPDGKIAHVMRPFREVDATSYEELAKAVGAVKSSKGE